MLSYRWAVIQAQVWPKSIVKKQAWDGTYPIVINWTNRKVPFNRSNYTSTVTVTSRTIDLERKEFSVFHDWNLNKTGAFIHDSFMCLWLMHVPMTHSCAHDSCMCPWLMHVPMTQTCAHDSCMCPWLMHVPGTQRSVLKGFASNGTVQNGFATNGNNTKWTAQSSHCMMLIIIIMALYL